MQPAIGFFLFFISAIISYKLLQQLTQSSTLLLSILMSLDKIKSAKNLGYADRYSKNTIINGLIRNKIQTEMIGIKQSFAQILQKGQKNQFGNLQNRTTTGMKRNKIYSINPKIIEQSIRYNPLDKISKITQQFVAERQNTSYLIPKQQLIQINKARQDFNALATKLNRSDQIRYKTMNNLQDFGQYVKQSTIKQYTENVWLPSKPEIVNMIQDKKQQIQEQFAKSKGKGKLEAIQQQLKKFSQKITGMHDNGKKIQGFPLISGKKQHTILKPIQYAPQKYHKNDYKLLDNWLQNSLQNLNQEKAETTIKLNLIFSIYVSVWKQIIRLTYIQSEQKGLIIQKLFYSLLRLFWGLISQQQTLSRTFNIQQQTDNKQMIKLMEQRMEQLNKRHMTHLKQIQKLKQNNFKLSQTVISFQKVNHDLVDELEQITKQKKYFENQCQNISNNYFKTLQMLHEKCLIQMDVTKQKQQQNQAIPNHIVNRYKTYFMLNFASKPIILGRFKIQNEEPSTSKSLSVHRKLQEDNDRIKYNQRYGRKIKEIENQLVRYWNKKQDDLELRGMINTLVLGVKLNDTAVGTQHLETQQFECQFPQNYDQEVQKMLNKLKAEITAKFKVQLNAIQAQSQQKQILLQKWKSNYEQLQQKYKIIQETNMKLNIQLKRIKENNAYINKQIQTLKSQKQLALKQIQNINKTLENMKAENQNSTSQRKVADKQKNIINNLLQKQKENNKMLVRGNLQMKQKVQKFDIRYNSLLKSIKSVAPWLEKFMGEVDKVIEQIDLKLLRTISQKIQQNLSQFITKDSSLFMTRLT